MKTMTDKTIDELLTRGVGEFIDPEGIFRQKLENNPGKIVIKFGIDPTRPDIHLGHAVVLRKLRQFQDLGCKIIFLIGDYTAQIGDPTGKNKDRPQISPQEVNLNAESYLKQVSAILDTSNKGKYEVLANGAWYQSVTDYPGDITMKQKSELWEADRVRYQAMRSDYKLPTITLWNFMFSLKHITHSQLIERDMFQKRIKSGEQLHMHEMMYPVLQGLDSHVIAGFFDFCDLEVGGTDQTFNMLMGRTVMKSNNQQPQAVLAFKLLEGLDGREKMSKSLDNYIAITDEPNDMYGKVMSIPDSSIANYFELCTTMPLEEVDNIRKKLYKNGSSFLKFWKNKDLVNPKDLKMNLARRIVEIYHGEKKAQEAEQNFVNIFQKGIVPEKMTELKLTTEKETLIELVVKEKIVSSKGDFRRLIEEGAVTNLDTDEKITDPNFIPRAGEKFKIGKRRFVKIT